MSTRFAELIYDKVKEDIFYLSNVRFFFKEIEKKKMADVFTVLCLPTGSAALSKAFGLRNLCYSKYL